MYTFIIVLIVIVAVLLAALVLIQNSKGGGLASSFASSNQIMGVRKTTDFLEKGTWGLAAAMVVLSILTTYISPSSDKIEQSVVLKEGAKPATNPVNTPAAGGFGATAPASTQGEAPTPTNAPVTTE